MGQSVGADLLLGRSGQVDSRPSLDSPGGGKPALNERFHGTIPSGHVAGALATALAVGTVMPGAGAVLLGLALSIAVASVLGRYHYLTDSGLGAVIAVAAWGFVE